MKFSIIVEARFNSSRLPGKILYKIGKYSFLEFLIKRLKLVKNTKNIIIATTDTKENEQIIKVAKKLKVNFFKGSENNVLDRVILAAKKFRSEYIIRITSDCPLVDPEIIDQAILNFKNNKCDYLSNVNQRSYPDGMDIEIFSLKALIRSKKFAITKKHKEWTTWSIRKNQKKFKIINFIAPESMYWPKLALTLDEYNDLIFLKKLIIKLKENYKVKCDEIISVLKKNKSLLKINKHVKRKY